MNGKIYGFILMLLGAGIPALTFAQGIKLENPRAASGFYVDNLGHIVTNAAAIEGCTRFHVRGRGDFIPTSLLKSDRAYDLALLKAEKPSPSSAILSADTARPSGQIYAIGYPIEQASIGLYRFHEGKITRGDDPAMKYLGLTSFTPVVPEGTSGGPLLDEQGQVIGVIQGQAQRMFNDAMSHREQFTPQSLAIISANLLKFLEPYKLKLRKAAPIAQRSMASVERVAAQFTVQIICK